MKRVLVIGGYGNFGAHIVKKLAYEPNMTVIIAGRSEEKCRAAAAQHAAAPHPPEYRAFDIQHDLSGALRAIRPDIVIHTSGPFQEQGYHVAETCIDYGCHYIDLADGRAFVSGIGILNDKARSKGVTVISGASSVPCLTSAVIDHYLPQFQKITSIDYGISTAQHTNTGLATTTAVLSYAGKPFQSLIAGRMRDIYGWQNIVMRKYPQLGFRLLANCDIPDLAIFPERYKDLQTIRFRAGLEITAIHLGLWLLSWFVRLKLIKSLAPYSSHLLKVSRLFDIFGSDNSAFHMELSGTGHNGKPKTATFYLVAKSGHGPFIPSTPAILCAKLLADNLLTHTGAMPCVGVLSLDQYLDALQEFDIQPVF